MKEHVFRHGSDIALVETTKGKVKGYEYDGLSIFKGIPYAKAARFHAPKPLEAWEGVLDATSYGAVCPLMNPPCPNNELLAPHRYWAENENCQNLNVWTPGCDEQKRPVLVWLHGGGFIEGSAIEQVAYEGENMSRRGQMVVVSVNHRHNLLGFCDLSEFGDEYANSGNAGMEDIIASLRWIRDNIAKFGGDPDNVTIMGQSGGGEKISALLQMPAADGLYHKAILMSGILDPAVEDTKGSGRPLIEAMLKELDTSDVKLLEKLPYQELISVYRKVSPALKERGEYAGLVPNPNAFYRGMPLEAGFRKETAHIPMMIGTVFGEMANMIPEEHFKAYLEMRQLSREEQLADLERAVGQKGAKAVAEVFEKYYPERPLCDWHFLDMVFRSPTKDYIDQRKKLNACTYVYECNQDFLLNGGMVPWHCTEIPFMLYNTELVPVTAIPGVTGTLERQMAESVIAFARTGDPNHAFIPQWPPVTEQRDVTMVFDAHTRISENRDAELLPVFRRYVGPVYCRELQGVMHELFGEKWDRWWQQ